MPTPFTIRDVPDNLHSTWKVISSLKKVSMRLYVLRALRHQLELDIDVFQEKDVLRGDLKKKLEVF